MLSAAIRALSILNAVWRRGSLLPLLCWRRCLLFPQLSRSWDAPFKLQLISQSPTTIATKVVANWRKLSNRERGVLIGCLGIFLAAAIGLLWQTSHGFLLQRPARGGQIREGIVGEPRFINPLLALSNSDRDLTTLIYS